MRLALPFGAAAWWLSLGQANAVVQTILGVMMTAALGYVAIAGVFDKRRREQEKADLAAEVERIRTLDQAHKETLAGQLDEIKRKAAAADAESRGNQERMRATLHEIRNQLNARELENHELREDLRAAHKDSVELSRQLAEANSRISALTSELARANARISALTSEVVRLNRDETARSAKVEALVQGVAEKMDSTILPAVRATPDPDADPNPKG
jgi:chromosome segregation ATPase